jgi:hypothetical protein
VAKKKKSSRKTKARDMASLPPERAGILRKLLEDPAGSDTVETLKTLSDPELAVAFLEHLPAGDPGLVPVLTAVCDFFDQKDVRKAFRRTAFRFQQQGVSVPLGPSRETSALKRKPSEKDQPFAFLTSLDTVGARGVLLGIPRPPMWIELGAAFASDEQGILQYSGGSFSKKKATGARDQFLSAFKYSVPASLEHAVAVLERSHQARPDGSGSAEYLQARPWILNRFSPLTTPPVYNDIPLSELTGSPFTESMATRLLDHEIMVDWMLDPRALQPLAQQIREAGKTRIYLTEGQQLQRIDEIKREWIRDYFKDKIRERIRYRLEETAYVLLRMDDKEHARLACIAALSLVDHESILDEHPLLRLMTEKTLMLFLRESHGEHVESQEDPRDMDRISPGGLIIP